jgi:hypothetical protein
MHWPVESPTSRALSNLLLGTSSSLVAFPLTSRPAAPPLRAARTPAPPRRAPATAPPVPPAVRRHRVPHRSITTHARRAPTSSAVLGPADDSAARLGSCGKPPGPLYGKSGKEWYLLALPFGRPLRTDTLLVKRRPGRVRRYTSLAQEDVPSACGCSRGTRSSSLRRQGPDVVERAAVLPDVVAQRERWAKLAKRTTAELDGRPSSNRPAPKRTAPRYPARVAQIVARLPRRTTRSSTGAPLTPANVDARERCWRESRKLAAFHPQPSPCRTIPSRRPPPLTSFHSRARISA